eukprot:13037506-Ditylum_brightwellii.AAC.1
MVWKFPVVLHMSFGWTKPTIIPCGRMQLPKKSKPCKTWSALNFANTGTDQERNIRRPHFTWSSIASRMVGVRQDL